MKYLRAKEVMRRYGIKSRVTLDYWERQGLLPPRVQIGKNTMAWREDLLDEFDEGRVRGIARQATPAEAGAT